MLVHSLFNLRNRAQYCFYLWYRKRKILAALLFTVGWITRIALLLCTAIAGRLHA